MNKVVFIKGFIENVEFILNFILAASQELTYSVVLDADGNETEPDATNAPKKEKMYKLVAMGIGTVDFEDATADSVTTRTYTFTVDAKYNGFAGGSVTIDAIGTDTVIAFVGK